MCIGAYTTKWLIVIKCQKNRTKCIYCTVHFTLKPLEKIKPVIPKYELNPRQMHLPDAAYYGKTISFEIIEQQTKYVFAFK